MTNKKGAALERTAPKSLDKYNIKTPEVQELERFFSAWANIMLTELAVSVVVIGGAII